MESAALEISPEITMKPLFEDPRAYAALISARLPFAVLAGEEMRLVFVNPAFCSLVGQTCDVLLGHPLAIFLPEKDECINLLHRVYRNGIGECHTESADANPHPVYWSYDVWPTWERGQEEPFPSGVILQVTETARFHRRAELLNQALLVSAVRQHELIEETVSLNAKLTAEIEERKRVELAVEQLAYYDPLTDLPNRRLIMDRLHHATIECGRTLNHGAIVFIDLDHFKSLNDTKGHHLGDLLLQQTAQRLKDSIRKDDTVGRLGGDEFVLLLRNLSPVRHEATAQAKSVATKVIASLDRPYRLAEHTHQGSGSIGIAMFGKDCESVTELLTHADMAQYSAKSSGGAAFHFFDAEMHALALSRAALESDLRQAVQRKQLRLYYQPQVDETGKLVGYEALLRWIHPQRGVLLPAEFIATAEQHGVIESIGMWVAETACEQLVKWGLRSHTSHLMLAINISAREFGQTFFVDKLLNVIDEVGANPKRIILELTERAILSATQDNLGKMQTLKERGLQFSLDDFGIGFSSLSSLRSLPVSQLKLDRSFIAEILTSDKDQAIADSVIALGKTLRMAVIAEGIESMDQFELLERHGCRLFQGFLFGRPAPLDTHEVSGPALS